jgi:hypothetical protein
MMQFGSSNADGAGILRSDIERMEVQEAELAGNVNYLLKLVGINSDEQEVGSHELLRVASSIFVALFEKLFTIRLDGVIRNPTTKSDYVVNAQRVVDGLAQQIQMDLQHITGLSIVNGDLQALSNLVHIFFHIVSITNAGSQSSSESHNAHDMPRQLRTPVSSGESVGESLSTHESTFAESKRKRKGPNLRKMAQTFQRNMEIPENLKGNFQHIIAKEAEGVLRSSEIMLAQQQRLEAARRRREGAMNNRSNHFGYRNREKEHVSNKALQARFLEESSREEDAFNLRRSNEEHVMLRKIYKGLLSKMHEWRADKHEEVRDRVNTMRDEAKTHIKALQTLFEDRVKVLRESELEARHEDHLVIKAHRRMGTDMQRSWAMKQRRTIATRKDQVSQARDHELLIRREAHKNLLALLSSEKWSDSLRQSEMARPNTTF